jgi:hypothetical protein
MPTDWASKQILVFQGLISGRISVMSTVSAVSDKRKIYLINHDPIEHLNRIQVIHALGKFVVEQTIREFRNGAYNDGVLGELYSLEEQARRRLYSDEYYLELLVPVTAILDILENDRVMIKSGFTPQVLALRTLQDKNYAYDQEKTVFHREKESRAWPNTGLASSARSHGYSSHHYHSKREFKHESVLVRSHS